MTAHQPSTSSGLTAADSLILRKNEKLLRGCPSIQHASKVLPTLITEPQNCESERICLVGKSKRGFNIYRLASLKNSVYFIPGYLDAGTVTRVASEIVEDLIDNPPHANSLPEPRKNLWHEYLQDPLDQSLAMNKLRWSCVGYHYDWGNRSYDPTKRSKFPKSFTAYYEEILACINEVTERPLSGKAESAIINFYHSHRISDRLGGHRDDVEVTDATPLVSLSLGLGGIFLIEDQAIYLQSGDVLVMADEARQSLHAVPVIFSGDRRSSSRVHLDKDPIANFLAKTRISISVRQVYSEAPAPVDVHNLCFYSVKYHGQEEADQRLV